MLQNILNTFIRIFIGLMLLGLAVALFLIGIVALWYFLLFGMAFWVGRRLYLAWKLRNTGPVQADGVEIIIHEEAPQPRSHRPGRVIDHE